MEIKDLSDMSIRLHTALENCLYPIPDYFNDPTFRIKFDGSCLRSDNSGISINKIKKVCVTCEIAHSVMNMVLP